MKSIIVKRPKPSPSSSRVPSRISAFPQRHLRECFNCAGDIESSKQVSLLHPVCHMDNIRHLKMADTKEGAAVAGLIEVVDENIQRQVELGTGKQERRKCGFHKWE